ncbi:MAG TPA: lantibiotic dehydratase C-terminal domain-containing protein [Beutenbergiaceae bacterium]|nr:lantibiotic dehydratase C-terminal domain-containing protein [Beutenbergiaceae bacterium]
MRQRVLYWQILHRDYGLDDMVIEDVVKPVVAEHAPDHPWHFLRYFDERGPHLRLRIFAESGAIDTQRYEAITSDLDGALMAAMNAAETRHVRDPSPFETQLLQLPQTPGVGVHAALYEPEVEKYGDIARVRAAERIWCASTLEALRHITPQWSATDRLLHAATDAFHASVLFFQSNATAVKRFWTKYAQYWAGGSKATLTDLANDPRLHTLALEAEAGIDGHDANTWPERFVRMCTGDINMFNHQLHLHHNRLGISPGVEAPLAVLSLLFLRRFEGDLAASSTPLVSSERKWTA